MSKMVGIELSFGTRPLSEIKDIPEGTRTIWHVVSDDFTRIYVHNKNSIRYFYVENTGGGWKAREYDPKTGWLL